jgi:hypothetical protein
LIKIYAAPSYKKDKSNKIKDSREKNDVSFFGLMNKKLNLKKKSPESEKRNTIKTPHYFNASNFNKINKNNNFNNSFKE